MYVLRDGTEVTREQIEAAFTAGQARLINGRGDHYTNVSLMLDGKDFDTRGECYSMWDEAWTRTPKTLDDCLAAARCSVFG